MIFHLLQIVKPTSVFMMNGNSDDDGFKLLEKLFQILKDEGVLQPKSDDPVVVFRDPKDLLKEFDFSINNDTPLELDKIEKICRDVMKYSTKTNHVNFHAILFAGYDPYGLCASWIIDALNTCPITYDIAPVFSLIEEAVIQKLLTLYGINDGDGIFTPGGSIACMYGMTLARHKKFPETKKVGMFSMTKPLVIFTSKEGHYCITKGANWLGIGQMNVVEVETNEIGQMCVKDLERKIKKNITDGKTPYFVNATSGTTVLAAYDDLLGIAEICRKYDLWMHVDGCYGGHVIFSKKYKHLMAGTELCDSLAYCPQKMGGTPMQCAVFLTRHKGLLLECNNAGAGYVFPKEKHYDVSYDPGDRSVQCGKKVDGFKLWLMLKARGTNGFEETVDNIFDSANYLLNTIKAHDAFRLVTENKSSPSVCFWYIPKHLRNKPENADFWAETDKTTTKIISRLVRTGKQMIGYSKLSKHHSANFFRVALVGYPRPTKATMDAVVRNIEEVGEEI